MKKIMALFIKVIKILWQFRGTEDKFDSSAYNVFWLDLEGKDCII